MRLLFIDFTLPQLLRDAELPAGGWAVQLRQLLIGLAEAGHRGGVLTWKGANAYVGPQSICDLLETYDPERGIRKLRFLTDRLPSLFMAARAWQPDVMIQSCSGLNTGIMALIAGALDVPFVHRIASDPDTDGRYVQFLDFRGRVGFHYGLKRTDFVICQNSYQQRQLAKRFPGKPTGILHNCFLVPSNFPPPKPRAERSYVAWIGNFRKAKNVPLLCEIARHSPELEFRIAGIMSDVAKEPELRMAVDQLRAMRNVTFVGYLRRDAVMEFLADAITLLCTSDFEGFSNTFLESFAAGTPVVLREAVDPDSIVERHGLGCVARDACELGVAVRNVSSLDSGAYEDLARRCRSYVERNHSISHAAAKLVALLQPLTAGAMGS